ncbi:hypothetical protein ACFFV7_10920 [Nonomuraea spiralis]|uniref:Uncharacterized protein n=1 Tax=Nonomuraea spiralis TaxID=46182 RepID=A0ABV5IB00_9ACTN|nr:hypothetical protein [Nonomuraea spiralis]
MSESDELSFGDDREPWLRGWIEAHGRLTAMVVAGVAPTLVPAAELERRWSQRTINGEAGVDYRALVQAQIEAGLRELDGVDEVFLQDKPFGMRLSRLYQGDAPPLTLDRVPEILYVRFDDPAKAKTVGQEMLRMPGVGWSQLIK